MTNIIKRTTLIVRDIETSTQWYEQVLGMSRYYDDEVVLSGVGMAAGNAGDRTHLVILKCADPEIGMIGLLQWIEPPLPAPAEIPTSVGYGNPTFVVAADDSRAACEVARKLGTPIHAEPHEWSIKGANGMLKNFIGVSLFDPDGHFYELNQLVSESPAP
jgi:catechol 2,3-dioxygenase-like lactoylglutathione lyase family enzyme